MVLLKWRTPRPSLKLTTLGPVKSGRSCYETSLLKTIAIHKTVGLLFHKVFQWLCTLALDISCGRILS